MGYMFSYCTNLTSLDVSNWDISKATTISGAFNNCTVLVDFKAPKNISAPMDVSYSTALSHDSLMSIINNLITVTSSKTLTLGATNLAKLTADEIAIATNKGWTVK
jgi:surface protein